MAGTSGVESNVIIPEEPVVFISLIPRVKEAEAIDVSRIKNTSSQADKYGLSDRLFDMKISSQKTKIDSVELTFWNEDLYLLDTPIMQHGTVVRLNYGYSGYVGPTRRFKIKTIEGVGETITKFGKIKITCYAIGYGLSARHRCRKFVNTRATDIARKIAKEYGFKADSMIIPPSGIHHQDVRSTYIQTNESDAQFLTNIALMWGYEFSVSYDEFVFAPSEFREKGSDIKYYRFYDDDYGWIKKWNPETTVIDGRGAVKLKTRNPLTCKINSVTVTPQNKVGKSMGKRVSTNADTTDSKKFSAQSTLKSGAGSSGNNISALKTGRNAINNSGKKVHRSDKLSKPGVDKTSKTLSKPNATKSKLKAEANTLQQNEQFNTIKSTMTILGDPDLWNGQLIYVDNVGFGMDGIWRIHECYHKFNTSDGYITELVLRRDAHNSKKNAGGNNAKDKRGKRYGDNISATVTELQRKFISASKKIAKNLIKQGKISAGVKVGKNTKKKWK